MLRFYFILLILALGLSTCVTPKNTYLADTLPNTAIVLATEISLSELAGTWKFKNIFASLEDRNSESFSENVEQPILNSFNNFSVTFNLSEENDNLVTYRLDLGRLAPQTFLAWIGRQEELELSSFFCQFDGEKVEIFSEEDLHVPLLIVRWTLAKNQLVLGEITAKSQDLFGVKNYTLKQSVWLFSNK